MTKKRVAILISGRGSNMQALIDACTDADFPAEIALVVSNKPDAYGLTCAEAANIATQVIDHRDYDSRDTYDSAIDRQLEQHAIDIVCLAGFMRLLSASFTEKWYGRMLNIHPSLLPEFKGLDTHRRALEASVAETGCTVHFVVPEMDAGPIILQAAVPVLADDDEQTLAARVLEQEHIIYPQALRWLAEDRLVIEGDRVRRNMS